jgi:hypothetical protein
MADGTRIESGTVGVSNVPGAALPEVSMPTARTEIAYTSGANYANTLGNVLDRLTSKVFAFSAVVSEKAGFEYAVGTPLDEKQLEAIAKGDTSSVPTGIGSDFNVYSAAIKKYRTLEIASTAEISVRQALLDEQKKILEEETEGVVGIKSSAERIKDKAESISKGYRDSLRQIDPEAAFKFSAMSAKLSGELIIDAAKSDAKKRMIKNSALESINYDNSIRELELSFYNGPRIDSKTNEPIPVSSYAKSTTEDVMTKAILAGGIELASSRAKTISKDISQAKVNAITRRVLDFEVFTNPNTLTALRSNDTALLAGALKESLPVWQSMTADEQAKVRQGLTLALNDSHANDERQKQKKKDELDNRANGELVRYWDPETPLEEKEKIKRDLAYSGALTNSEIENFFNPDKKEGDNYLFGDLLYKVNSGELNSIARIKHAARTSGMNGQQYTQLIRAFNEFLGDEDAAAVKYINSASGVPDVTTIRTKNDEAQFNKRDILLRRYRDGKREALKTGKPFDLNGLAEFVVGKYNDSDRNNIQKSTAQTDIDAITKQINETRKTKDKTLPDIKIDANTNLDDLESAKVIDPNMKRFLKSRQDILNKP